MSGSAFRITKASQTTMLFEFGEIASRSSSLLNLPDPNEREPRSSSTELLALDSAACAMSLFDLLRES
jgi:hypothetical protein